MRLEQAKTLTPRAGQLNCPPHAKQREAFRAKSLQLLVAIPIADLQLVF